jgi:hypothetical protein
MSENLSNNNRGMSLRPETSAQTPQTMRNNHDPVYIGLVTRQDEFNAWVWMDSFPLQEVMFLGNMRLMVRLLLKPRETWKFL